jgi:hypothetical protein
MLYRLADFWRKFAHRGLIADWTLLDLCPMLGNFHLDRWHIKDLALLAVPGATSSKEA